MSLYEKENKHREETVRFWNQTNTCIVKKSQRNSSSTQGPAEFSNGLISDLAPLLALFGEQLTKQFMSQSMYWSDHIMFAMAPLGIIAACVGAIRVAGPTWMKAIIGRARESRGLAEVELLSSTSHDVCELWNGRQIVRVLGSAPVKQLLCFPDHLVEDEHGLYTLEEAVHKGLMIAVKGKRDNCTSNFCGFF